MQNSPQKSLKNDLKNTFITVFNFVSYVFLGIITLFNNAFFLYLVISSTEDKRLVLIWIFGTLSLISLFIYIVDSLIKFLPLKNTRKRFLTLDVFSCIMRFLFLSAGIFLLILALLYEGAFSSFLRAYGIALLAIEAIFFFYSLFSFAWYKENPNRYTFGEDLIKEEEKPTIEEKKKIIVEAKKELSSIEHKEETKEIKQLPLKENKKRKKKK